MLSSKLSFRFSFTSIVNEFEVFFCKLQTEYSSPRFRDQFKVKLAVFSLAKGVGRNRRKKRGSFLTNQTEKTMFRKIIKISQGVLNTT